jgi:hypothetical protein
MREARIVAEGKWIYAGTVPKAVFVIGVNYDFWYELVKEDRSLEAGEEPDLNGEGRGYYVSFHGIRANGSFWPDSGTYHSIGEARAAAESRVPSSIFWSPT